MFRYHFNTVQEAYRRLMKMMQRYKIACAGVGEPATEAAKQWRRGREESFEQIREMLINMQDESK